MATHRPPRAPGTGPVGGGRRAGLNPRAWGSTFASLHEPAFARYFAGTLAFFFSMQMLLRGYLIYDLTHDALALGFMSLTFALPMLVVAPIAGVVADRIDRRKIIVASQSLGCALTALTTVLVLTGAVQFWHLLVISLFSSSTMVFNMPARQAVPAEIRGAGVYVRCHSLLPPPSTHPLRTWAGTNTCRQAAHRPVARICGVGVVQWRESLRRDALW